MMRRIARAESGAAIVELALVLPVLMAVLMGIIEVGRYAYLDIVAAHAARSGAQYGAQTLVSADDGIGMKAAANADVPAAAPWTVSTSVVCTTNNQVTAYLVYNAQTVSPALVYYVQVKITGYFIRPLLHYPGIPSNVPITATSM